MEAPSSSNDSLRRDSTNGGDMRSVVAESETSSGVRPDRTSGLDNTPCPLSSDHPPPSLAKLGPLAAHGGQGGLRDHALPSRDSDYPSPSHRVNVWNSHPALQGGSQGQVVSTGLVILSSGWEGFSSSKARSHANTTSGSPPRRAPRNQVAVEVYEDVSSFLLHDDDSAQPRRRMCALYRLRISAPQWRDGSIRSTR